MSDQIVIDLSHWQPDPIDWAALIEAGTIGVILKATEGESYVDPTFAQRRVDALAAGLCVASYHFLRPGDMIAQMQWYLEVADPDIGQRLVLDWEDEGVSIEDVEKAAAFLIEGEFTVAIYGSNIMVDACKGKHSPVLERTSLWQARYGNNEPQVPDNIWPTWSLWQYTQHGEVAGIKGDVDLNRWNGDPEDLAGWFDSSEAIGPFEPLPIVSRDEVHIDVTATADPGIKIYLTINGQAIVLE